jgi:hypothetical protein
LIAPPTRSAAVPRGAASQRYAGPNGGDADNTAALAALDARVTALVARSSTPGDEALDRQREAFDVITREGVELEREANALRELAIDQMKHDDEILKKWIELI